MLLKLACNCTFCYLQSFLNEYSCVKSLSPCGSGGRLTNLQHHLLSFSFNTTLYCEFSASEINANFICLLWLCIVYFSYTKSNQVHYKTITI